MNSRAFIFLRDIDASLADLENRQLAAYRGFCALSENGLSADERRDRGTARTQLLYPDAKTPKEVRAMTAGLSTSGGLIRLVMENMKRRCSTRPKLLPHS